MKTTRALMLLIPVITLFIGSWTPAATGSHVKPVELTDANFKQKVLSADKLSVVDFWAPWCGPCRAVGPVMEALSKDYHGKVNVGKVNVDENPQLCYKYRISSIPTILFIKKGKVVDKLVGAHPKSSFVKKIKQHMYQMEAKSKK